MCGQTKMDWICNLIVTTLSLTFRVIVFLPSDCVVRTHYYKYFHPKECLVANGILNRAIASASGKFAGSDHNDHNSSQ
jgi:hypothetical protein